MNSNGYNAGYFVSTLSAKTLISRFVYLSKTPEQVAVFFGLARPTTVFCDHPAFMWRSNALLNPGSVRGTREQHKPTAKLCCVTHVLVTTRYIGSNSYRFRWGRPVEVCVCVWGGGGGGSSSLFLFFCFCFCFFLLMLLLFCIQQYILASNNSNNFVVIVVVVVSSSSSSSGGNSSS